MFGEYVMTLQSTQMTCTHHTWFVQVGIAPSHAHPILL